MKTGLYNKGFFAKREKKDGTRASEKRLVFEHFDHFDHFAFFVTAGKARWSQGGQGGRHTEVENEKRK